jgi:hypothetical protein
MSWDNNFNSLPSTFDRRSNNEEVVRKAYHIEGKTYSSNSDPSAAELRSTE